MIYLNGSIVPWTSMSENVNRITNIVITRIICRGSRAIYMQVADAGMAVGAG